MGENDGDSSKDIVNFSDSSDYAKDPGAYLDFVVPKVQSLKRKSKIELAGEHVTKHLLKLCKDTDLSYAKMAAKINKLYNLDLTKNNVVHFFRSNTKALELMAQETKSLNMLRAKTFLEHHTVLTKDIKKLEKQIEAIEDDKEMDNKTKTELIIKLIDQKGKLLIRHGKLKGDIVDKPNAQVQVNIMQNMQNEKSDLIQRMKKADFKEDSNVIDI